MKRILAFLLIIPLLISAQEKLNIAVMELDGNGVSPTDLGGLSNRLRTELFKTGKFDVIERSRMNDILKEQGFQQTGCTNTECAVEIGQLIGVQKIIVGSVDKVADIFTVDIRMVDVATGKIEKTSTEDCDACGLGDVLKVTIHNVASQMAGVQSAGATVPVSEKPQTVQTAAAPVQTVELKEWEKLGLKNREDWVQFKQSDKNIDTWKKEKYSKSVGGAVMLSILLPGGGHYYNGKKGAGVFYTLVPSALLVTGSILTAARGLSSGQQVTGFILLSTSWALHLTNIIHAGAYASRYNKGTLKHPPKNYPFKKVSINPSYDPFNKQTKLSLSYNF